MNQLHYLIILSVGTMGVTAGRLPFLGNSAAFSQPTSSKRDEHQKVVGQPEYHIASVDLSARWTELVRDDKVAANVQIKQDNGSEVTVRYGVRLAPMGDKMVYAEFVEEVGLPPGKVSQSDLVRGINETLVNQQNDPASDASVDVCLDGDFTAQLQLVRALRPAPSPGFAGSTTSTPPPYDASVDSFVAGPLRLELRPLVGSLIQEGMTTAWDVFHNVSPADTRGHFLLLPTLSDEAKNWRGQMLTPEDCNDMVYLTHSIEPAGSLFLGFNSVGAGASQNHIHCHAWPSPPIPLRPSPLTPVRGQMVLPSDDRNSDAEVCHRWNCYAISKVGSMYDLYDIQNGRVEVSYLKYPVFCVQLSASEEDLELLGKALSTTLEAVGEAPFNIGFLNRLETDLEDEDAEPVKYTDIFVFARSQERSQVLPSLKLGISEMMGVFHAQSKDELELLTPHAGAANEEGPMMQALTDVSVEDDETLWESVKENLGLLDQ